MEDGKRDRRILVVDDDQLILETIGQVLEGAGYTVHLLRYGDQIFQNIGDFVPDLIILDVDLGTVDGSMLCNLINNTDRLRDIPVIMISGNPDMKYILAKTCPKSIFIEKPFDMGTLTETVRYKISEKIK